MDAAEGQEEGILEPRYGRTLFRKSLNMSGKKTAERALIRSFTNKGESREAVAAASHH